MSLSFENISYHVKSGFFAKSREKKSILSEISGAFNDRELSVILGVSGSGKSSLLDILSGFKRSGVSGSLRINGKLVTSNDVRKVSSYVMQETKLHRHLTVLETMMFAVNFKSKCDQNKRIERVKEVLFSLGLEEKISRMVKHLSGGEQKRLTIALELVDDPSILFLDEPTTGLDSSSSTQCVRLLKKLANEGKTIICTLHTPSALLFAIFDHVYTLNAGYCIYQGSSENLVPFLNDLDLTCPPAYNPADFLIEIASSGTENDRLKAKACNGNSHIYRRTFLSDRNLDNESTVLESLSNAVYMLSFGNQVKYLLHRSFLIFTRDKTLVLMRLCIHIAMGFVFGLLYRGVGNDASKFFDNYRYIIASVVFQLYTSYFSLQVTIPLEFPLLKRERFNRWYSSSAFFTAFILIDLPITFLCSFFYVTITYVLTDQPLEIHRYFAFFCVSIALCFASQGIGLVGSALLDVKSAAIFGGLFLAPFFTFSSTMLLMKDTSSLFHWLFYTNFVDNAIKGSIQAIFGLNRGKIECEALYCHYSYPSKILQEVEAYVSVKTALMVLITYAIMSRILTFFFIKYRLKN